MFFAGRGCGRNSGGEVGGGSGRVETRVDTVIVRDTLRDTLLVPVDRLVVRFDTVWLPTVSAWVGADGEVAVSAKSDRSQSTARTLFNCQSGGMERGASGSPTPPGAPNKSPRNQPDLFSDPADMTTAAEQQPDLFSSAPALENITTTPHEYRTVGSNEELRELVATLEKM